MAPASHTNPNAFRALQTPDGRYYWRLFDYALAYTVSYTCLPGSAFTDIAKEMIVVYDHIVVLHKTNAANERSGFVGTTQTMGLRAVLESGDATDEYDIYGPAYAFPPLENNFSSSAMFIVYDQFSEWTGNCDTYVNMFGRLLPRASTATIQPEYPTPVEVKKLDVWPWRR